MRLTLSTDGVFDAREVHDVEGISAGSRYLDTGRAAPERRDTAVITLDNGQAMAIAADLLYQLVDAGVISGWNVQFPERDAAAAC